MVSVLNYNNSKQEAELIRNQIKDLAAYLSEDKWEIPTFRLLSDLEAYMEETPLLNLSCYDVTKKENLEFLHEIRKIYQEMKLMLVADKYMSPMEYIKPDILASELILRPFHENDLRSKLRSLMEAYLNKESEQDVFVVDTKEEKMRIPYSQIYYFQAREKKLFVRLKKEGYAFYGTLDALEETVPKQFVRCHRGFMVNWKKVDKVLRSQGQLILADGIEVPFSRSYRGIIMELSQ